MSTRFLAPVAALLDVAGLAAFAVATYEAVVDHQDTLLFVVAAILVGIAVVLTGAVFLIDLKGR